jgi:hypothetical protein
MVLAAKLQEAYGWKVLPLAFPDSKSKGTWNMVGQLRARGFKPLVFKRNLLQA